MTHATAYFLIASVVGFYLFLLVRKLNKIRSVADRLASGDLGARTRMGGNGRVGSLGKVLDQLADRFSNAIFDLKREKALLENVLEGMQEGVLLLDDERRIVLVNNALRDMLLLKPDVIGRSLIEVARYVELNEILTFAYESEQPIFEEIELIGLKPRRLLVKTAKLTGESKGLLAVFMDITDLARLESLRRDFVGNVSHELRTPVTVLRSAAETLRTAFEDDPKQVIPLLDMIDRNVDRMHNLIEDLLDLSRIESKEFHLRVESIDLYDPVSNVISQFDSKAKKKSIEMKNNLVKNEFEVLADRSALEQVLINLVDNAVKYCPQNSQIAVDGERISDPSRIVLKVQDTGPGIEEKHLSRIFERFYRVDPARSREAGGTGLGLSIVKNLIQAMGGSVSVESAVGEGSTFIVMLPTSDSPDTRLEK